MKNKERKAVCQKENFAHRATIFFGTIWLVMNRKITASNILC